MSLEQMELRAVLSGTGAVAADSQFVGAPQDNLPGTPAIVVPERASQPGVPASNGSPVLVPPDDTIDPIAHCPRLDPRLCLPQEMGPRQLRSVLQRPLSSDSATTRQQPVPSRAVLLLSYRNIVPLDAQSDTLRSARGAVYNTSYLTQFTQSYQP
jgi:hypothetical protein